MSFAFAILRSALLCQKLRTKRRKHAATLFLTTLNDLRPSLTFTMELPVCDRIPFICIVIIQHGTKLKTQVYILPVESYRIDSVISNFDSRNPSVNMAERNTDESNIVRISLPFKDQVSANAVRRQWRDLSNKIGPTLQSVFVRKKLEQDLKSKEAKPSPALSISNALFIILYLICVMQILSATQPDTFFNELLNTEIRQSASIFMKRMVRAIF